MFTHFSSVSRPIHGSNVLHISDMEGFLGFSVFKIQQQNLFWG